MKLTQKLLGYLSRVFDKGPAEVLALRLRYDGAMTWRVEDGVLSTAVVGGSGVALVLTLSNHTIGSLAEYLAALPGYSVPYLDPETVHGLSALALIDASGDQGASNGDHLHAFTSVLWAYMEGQASELVTARASIGEALVQMSAATAAGEWVDEHGSYYGVVRLPGESDAAYAVRMIAEVGRARGNNIAISEAVRIAGSALRAEVKDIGTVTTASNGTKSFGLFDVNVDMDAEASFDFAQADSNVRAIVRAMRDAGTHMRTLRYAWKIPAHLPVATYLQVGMVITVFARESNVSWTNSQGLVLPWVNATPSVVDWFSTLAAV